jgi:hypothetical protein
VGALADKRILLLADKAAMCAADPYARVPAGALPRSLPPVYGTIVALAVDAPFVLGAAAYTFQDLPLAVYWDLVAGRVRSLDAATRRAQSPRSPRKRAAKALEAKETAVKETAVKATAVKETAAKAPAVKALEVRTRSGPMLHEPTISEPVRSQRAAASKARRAIQSVAADPKKLQAFDEAGYVSSEDSDFTLPASDESDSE